MQVFDYHINPKSKKGLIFKSFYFQPENEHEKPLGDLCIIGEFSDSLSKDKKILEDLSHNIKEGYFSDVHKTPLEALKSGLQKGNKFLEELSLQGNVRWLGNLSIAAIAVNGVDIHFSKSGNVKLLLLRSGEYHDIGENLEFQKQSPDKPTQIFSNVASGNLIDKDRVIILTQELFEFFHIHIAEPISNFPSVTPNTLAKLLKDNKSEMKEYSGVMFVMAINKKGIKRQWWPIIKTPLAKKIALIIAFIVILLLSFWIFR
ncbi:hypothetical protein KKG29_05740 [Patescibacteria group bacterium]|nr:hypothetical protein [Patescibacteria group bacterium]MBU4000640.1 hypothetical protein [Patescibacteria group bacterium]MBU4162094.1 hypothetical protein [Patescibacteria group bacterium]